MGDIERDGHPAKLTEDGQTLAEQTAAAHARVHSLRLIEHEINWCDTFECDGPAIEDPEYPGTCDDCGAEVVRVKVVRADAAQGAVEALSVIADDRVPSPHIRERVRVSSDVQAYAQGALTRLRGQA